IYSTKNVVSTFYDDAHQASIFCFHPENMPVLRENQYNYIRFDSLNPPLQYSRIHDSIIPIAERSGAKFPQSILSTGFVLKIPWLFHSWDF
ncbi:MAG: hypothetical protein WCB15_16505, partial [Desulfobacterales bacterium]